LVPGGSWRAAIAAAISAAISLALFAAAGSSSVSVRGLTINGRKRINQATRAYHESNIGHRKNAEVGALGRTPPQGSVLEHSAGSRQYPARYR
jgi:hypothetical protein